MHAKVDTSKIDALSTIFPSFLFADSILAHTNTIGFLF